jgi:hypothetical protein
MAVIDVNVTSREPFAEGRIFGAVGAYERIDGIFMFAVDPTHEANQGITDLALALRDADGRVRFASDFTLLVPVDPALGNRRLIVDVVNRGRRQVVPTFNLASPNRQGSVDVPVGDGFLFQRGYSVASVGWQSDVYRSDMLLGIDAPIAYENGKLVRGQVVVEIRPDTVQHTRLLANRVHRPYPVVDIDDPTARLLVRDWEDGPYEDVPRSHWRFAKESPEGIVPSKEHAYLEPGFQPGKIYHLIYTSEGSPVVGAGLLALRDAPAFLRKASDLSPVTGDFEQIFAYGVSQTGRLLRHFVYLGLNKNENGRQVYDGLLAHVAGARKGEFNSRFAQPSDQSTPGFGHIAPFTDNDVADPFSGITNGVLRKSRTQGVTPRIIYTNSSAEYWRGDASLTHISPDGSTDLDPAPESRIYLFASTQHADARMLPEPGNLDIDGTERAHPPNTIDYRPLLRTALVNLDRWVSEGVEPPPSKHPRLDDCTAVSRSDVLAGLGSIPGLSRPNPERLWVLREMDMGPEADKGIPQLPTQEGRAYLAFVSAVDSAGNEIAGVRLPDVAVPVATYLGWNPRHSDSGAPEQIIPMQGSSLLFAATREARERTNDPRQALKERYVNREDYVKRVQAEAWRLVADGYLLEEDVETVVANCAAHYDTVVEETA